MSINVCVVTGATSGIGEAITKSLASDGRVVVAIGRSSNVLRELEAINKNVVGYELDICDEKQVLALADFLTQRAYRVESLVHCAGTYTTGPFQSTSTEALDRMYQVNVRGPFLLTRALLDSLRSQGHIRRPSSHYVPWRTAFARKLMIPASVCSAFFPGARQRPEWRGNLSWKRAPTGPIFCSSRRTSPRL